MDAFLAETNGRGTYVGHTLTLLLISVGRAVRYGRPGIHFHVVVSCCVCDQLCIIVDTTLFYDKFYFITLATYFEGSNVEYAEQKLRQAKKAKMTYS